jgi:acyl-CoA reductase-like NAD-dependent aldehyde dehydrogenase
MNATEMTQALGGVGAATRSFLLEDRGMIIDGDVVPSRDAGTFETLNPGDGELLGRVARSGEADVDLAVAAARRALSGPWSAMPASARAACLFRLADLLEENAGELSELESLDVGNLLANTSAVDIPLSIDQYRYFAGWATKLEGATVPNMYPDVHVRLEPEPVGVVAAIVPWNFPLVIASWKVAPALAAGCTVVLKPAEQTPLTALRLGELALEADIPPGVLNVLPGFGDAGAALVAHPGVDKVAFTGSEPVGKAIARSAADTLKRVSLELGGKSPLIVMPDASAAEAATAAAGAIFYNSGQVCCAGSKLLVHDDVYDDVLVGLVEAADGLKVGSQLDPSSTMGPLVSQEQLDRVLSYVEIGTAEGGQAVRGGTRSEGLGDGYFMEPTVIADVAHDGRIASEEIFGPVVVAQRFGSVDELVERSNASDFGLAAGVFTNDLRDAHEISSRLDVGVVWINCYNLFDSGVPFGGYKRSGYGRDSGRAAIDQYLQSKSVWTNYGRGASA